MPDNCTACGGAIEDYRHTRISQLCFSTYRDYKGDTVGKGDFHEACWRPFIVKVGSYRCNGCNIWLHRIDSIEQIRTHETVCPGKTPEAPPPREIGEVAKLKEIIEGLQITVQAQAKEIGHLKAWTVDRQLVTVTRERDEFRQKATALEKVIRDMSQEAQTRSETRKGLINQIEKLVGDIPF